MFILSSENFHIALHRLYEPSSAINPDPLYKSVTPARYPLFFANVNSLGAIPLNITLTLCASSGNKLESAFGNLSILARMSFAEICLSMTSLTPHSLLLLFHLLLLNHQIHPSMHPWHFY